MFTRKDYVPGKPVEEVRREYGLTEIIKMASNENPLGVSPKAMEAMLRELSENGYRYPESLCTELAEKMARKLRVAPEDMGKVIGRQGRIAKEIRTVIRSYAQRTGAKVSVDIVD